MLDDVVAARWIAPSICGSICGWALACAAAGCGHAPANQSPSERKGYPAATRPATATQPTPAAAAAPAGTQTPPPQPASPLSVPPAPPRLDSTPQPMASAFPAPPPAPVAERRYEPPMPLASQGPRFTVRGVERDDVLNVRSSPGPKSPLVGTIPPETRGVLTTGNRRQLGPSVWREVIYGDVRGWVNERFLVQENDPERE